MGLLLLGALFLFILSILGAGAVFAYQGILNSSLTSKQEQLKLAEGAFEPKTIEDLSRLDGRLLHAQSLLGAHLAPSGVFDFLSTVTLANVQFTEFSYAHTGTTATIMLSGAADSFSTVALQSDQFGQARLLKDVVFSDVGVGQSGRVSFKVTATLDPSLYLYGKQAASTGAVPVVPPANTQTGSNASSTATTTRQ